MELEGYIRPTYNKLVLDRGRCNPQADHRRVCWLHQYTDDLLWQNFLSLPRGQLVITRLILHITIYKNKRNISRSTDISWGVKFYNESVTFTTPLTWMIFHSRLGLHSCAQPTDQIWSLWVHSLRSYEWRCKVQKIGWFGVTQGHWQCHHSIECIRLPIRL